MDCDSCGRYRPPDEVTAVPLSRGRIVWVCAGCRALRIGGRVEPASAAPAPPADSPHAAAAVPAR